MPAPWCPHRRARCDHRGSRLDGSASTAIVVGMGQLLVRNLPDDIVEALKAQARANGRSAEEEHRRILERALRPSTFDIKAHLLSIPVDDGDEELASRRDEIQREVDL